MFAGIDTHKDTLALAVIDPAGRVIHQSQHPNYEDGYRRLLAAADPARREPGRGRGVGQLRLARRPAPARARPDGGGGAAAADLPGTAGRPGQGKTDPVDAVAIARITAREVFLPPVRPMIGAAADLRVLTEYREQLVTERTILANRVHVDLVWLRPGYHHQLPQLTNRTHLRAALDLLAGDDSARARSPAAGCSGCWSSPPKAPT